MLHHISPDDDEDDYKYACTDAHRPPLARRRWARTETGLPLGMLSLGLSLLCLLAAILGVCGVFSVVSCCLRDEVSLVEDLSPVVKIMPWLCVASAFLGLYAYFKSGEEDDKTGLIGTLLNGVAFLAWMVVRVMSKI